MPVSLPAHADREVYPGITTRDMRDALGLVISRRQATARSHWEGLAKRLAKRQDR